MPKPGRDGGPQGCREWPPGTDVAGQTDPPAGNGERIWRLTQSTSSEATSIKGTLSKCGSQRLAPTGLPLRRFLCVGKLVRSGFRVAEASVERSNVLDHSSVGVLEQYRRYQSASWMNVLHWTRVPGCRKNVCRSRTLAPVSITCLSGRLSAIQLVS